MYNHHDLPRTTYWSRERDDLPERMNVSGYCRTIIETEKTSSSDNLRMTVLWSDNKQVPFRVIVFYSPCFCSSLIFIITFECHAAAVVLISLQPWLVMLSVFFVGTKS